VRLLSFIYVVRDFSNACALVFSGSHCYLLLGYGWMVFFFFAFEVLCLPLF
jgi:hypothetical protein